MLVFNSSILVSSVGSFFSYVNDARSHEPEAYVSELWCNHYRFQFKKYLYTVLSLSVLWFFNAGVHKSRAPGRHGH